MKPRQRPYTDWRDYSPSTEAAKDMVRPILRIAVFMGLVAAAYATAFSLEAQINTYNTTLEAVAQTQFKPALEQAYEEGAESCKTWTRGS